MREEEVRKALHSRVLARHHRRPDTLVVDELPLWYGTARIDVAVVSDLIHRYEIKSNAMAFDGTTLTMLWWKDERQLLDAEDRG